MYTCILAKRVLYAIEIAWCNVLVLFKHSKAKQVTKRKCIWSFVNKKDSSSLQYYQCTLQQFSYGFVVKINEQIENGADTPTGSVEHHKKCIASKSVINQGKAHLLAGVKKLGTCECIDKVLNVTTGKLYADYK